MFLRKQTSWTQGRKAGVCVAGLLWTSTAWMTGLQGVAETPPKPALRLPLSELGFPGYALSLLHAGASMATVHLLDGSHVLFTYSLRSLVPRLPGDDVNDTDRQVAAVLLEVPSGKVLARAKWHLHDHGRYLWSVGQGAFVLRSGSELSMLVPLQGLAAGDEPLRRYALPHRPGRPVAIEGSPDGKVVTVELESESQAAAGDEEEGGESGGKRKHYTVEFFRMTPAVSAKDPIQIAGAGAVGSPVMLRLPMDGDGYLWAEDGERGKWTVSFNEFGGKEEKLTPVMSSCHPRLSLLSRAEFLVETCRGTDESPMYAAYGFDGHENWEEQFGETLQPPVLALAPDAGRFAISRLVASSGGAPVNGMGSDDPINQEIRVYQTESGDLLLHLQCVPAVRSAENFDLSPDGKTLAVLGPETLDLYRLPELSARDRKELAELKTMTPPEGGGPVALRRITRPIAVSREVGTSGEVAPRAGATVAADAGRAGPGAATPSAGSAPSAEAPGQGSETRVAAPAQTAGGVTAAGDAGANSPRKPPTLLNPGENPEFKVPSTVPQ